MKKKNLTFNNSSRKAGALLVFAGSVAAMSFASSGFFAESLRKPVTYQTGTTTTLLSTTTVGASASSTKVADPITTIIGTPTTVSKKFTPIRVKTPEAVKAIYMTQCVVGTPNFRNDLVKLIESTEINSVVIDIKDYTGGLGYISDVSELRGALSENCHAVDMKEFVRSLNEKGIYVIGRITVFQDPQLALRRPDLAVQKNSDKTTWNDYKGLSFVDVGSKEVWDYIVTLSRDAYAIGFDELNYDYIRFPSDGPMGDIYYPHSSKYFAANPNAGKAEMVERFFAYLHEGLRDLRVVTSADLFGMVTTNTDDLNIGQQLERALPYFDYIAPMVYPSHFPKGFNGWDNPNEHVYGIISFSMGRGVERVVASTTRVATLRSSSSLSTSTPLFAKEVYKPTVLRPWLQDFDYGGNYDIAEVRAQIQAAYDVGLNSWMLWSPSNRYTEGAFMRTTTTSEVHN